MTASMYLETPQGRRLAYHKTEGTGPCVVFLGGLKSDLMGTKAVFLRTGPNARGGRSCGSITRVTGKPLARSRRAA